MRLKKILVGTSVAIFLTIGFACQSRYFSTFAQSLPIAKTADGAVRPPDNTNEGFHSPPGLVRFLTLLASPFGVNTHQQGILIHTPNTNRHQMQLVRTPFSTA